MSSSGVAAEDSASKQHNPTSATLPARKRALSATVPGNTQDGTAMGKGAPAGAAKDSVEKFIQP
jgi:hypothetical protein